jgi:hypothetical protein
MIGIAHFRDAQESFVPSRELTELECATMAANINADTVRSQQKAFSQLAADVADRLAGKGNEAYTAALAKERGDKMRHEYFGRSQAFYEAANAIRSAFDLHAECSTCHRKHGPEVRHAAE